MSKNSVRNDNTCLNCGKENLEDRFCPRCGQENVESHQSFRGLVFHFFEDLTHYDNAFWKTMKYLLFHPARLTKEYLSGKRKQFVPPVRLYIFISFVTFFLPTILPNYDSGDDPKPLLKKETTITEVDSIKPLPKPRTSFLGSDQYESVAHLDSLEALKPESERMGDLQHWMLSKAISRKSNLSADEIDEKFKDTFINNIPKALFLYMPLFGFWLWIFHGKRRWFFFDHAILTLHYFAFILLIITLSVNVLDRLIDLLPDSFDYILSNINGFITCSWIVIYFYIAHKRMYGESKAISFVKSTFLLSINIILAALLMICLAFYAWLNVH